MTHLTSSSLSSSLQVLPNIDCKHCVIRARYVPHKPGESTFYQCSDISISQSTAPLSSNPIPTQQDRDTEYLTIKKKIDRLRNRHDSAYVMDSICMIGFSFNPLNPNDAFLMSVNVMTGNTFSLEEFYINIALSSQRKTTKPGKSFYPNKDDHGNFVFDAISAINSNGNLVQLYTMGDSADDIKDYVMEVDLKHPGDIIKRAKIVNNYDYPINAIVPAGHDTYLTVTMADRVTKGNEKEHM